jgi:hypothetical protein
MKRWNRGEGKARSVEARSHGADDTNYVINIYCYDSNGWSARQPIVIR